MSHPKLEEKFYKRKGNDLIEAITDPVFLHDHEFRIINANAAYENIAGRSREEIIGKPYWQVFPIRNGPLPACARLSEKTEEEVTLVSGRTYVSRGYVVLDEAGEYDYSIHIFEDITEREEAKRALAESEEKFRSMSAALQDAVILVNDTGHIIYWNPSAEKIFGYNADEVYGRSALNLLASSRYSEDILRGWNPFKQSERNGFPGKFPDFFARNKDGDDFPTELSLSNFSVNGKEHIVAIVRDISSAQKAEQDRLAHLDFFKSMDRLNRALHGNKSLGQMMKETLNIVIDIFKCDRARFIYPVDPNAETWKVPMECVTSQYPVKTSVNAKYPMSFKTKSLFRQSLETEGVVIFGPGTGVTMPHELGENSSGIFMSIYPKVDSPWGFSIFQCSGERKWTPEELRIFREIGRRLSDGLDSTLIFQDLADSKTKLEEAERIAQVGYWELDLVRNQLEWSDEIYRMFEVKPRSFGATLEAFLKMVHPDDRAFVEKSFNDHLYKHKPYDIVHRLLVANGKIKYVHERCETSRDNEGKALRSLGSVQDITSQKLAEQAIERINRALKTLSAGNEVLVRAVNEEELLNEMCRIIVEKGGYRMAWVGYAKDDSKKKVVPIAQSGFDEGYLESIRMSWDESVWGQGPTGMAIRSGQLQICPDVKNSPSFTPWREGAMERGYRSVLALPLKDRNNRPFGALTIDASEVDAFDEEEVRLLDELAVDLAYGIVNLRMRDEKAKTTEMLRESLVATIQAIALTVEKRDPYTAGHQQKVSELCVAIGKKLGLDKDKLEGLRLGAMIHDIGKIYVPAEFLNRPGKLTGAEFELIKSHAIVGYDIIKDVKFPWPVVQMIVQHHERINGSGYPRGLRGRSIILESRILAVADVVEAISSHRPYRPAMGVDEAMKEIETQKNKLYDPVVVTACVELFRIDGFTFL